MSFVWPYPRVLAHRGGGSLAPENTLAAIRKGLALGHHAVEFDVMLTADEVPVLMHDPLLGRTIKGKGSIADLTISALLEKDAGLWFGAEYVGEPVPLYEDIVRYCREHNIWMNVELKPVPGHERRTGQVLAELTQKLFADEADRRRWPLFSSFQIEALQAARELAPEIPRGWLVDRVPENWQAQIETLACVAMDCNHAHLNGGLVAAIKAAGYGLLCYTVNDLRRARELLNWGVDALCTDRIDLIPADLKPA